ncbi:hypothetical protein, partial [Escherichia coli]|uniref:hypothetical protein n=1 Tax=Escherichia coli TaxID=562 RepID=UPI001BB288D8
FAIMNNPVIKSLKVEFTEKTLEVHLRIWKDPDTGCINSFISYGKITDYTPFELLKDHPDMRYQGINKAIEIWNRGFVQATLICKDLRDFLHK